MPTIAFFIQGVIIASVAMYASIYLSGILRGSVKPVLATWTFLSIATILSFITNFSESGMQGVLANSYNMIDSIATLVIFSVVLCKKGLRKTFTLFEIGCVAAVCLVFIAWIFSGQNVLAHLCLQIILVIAYIPTLVHLWYATEVTEPLSTWSLNVVAALFGLIEPAKSRALLPLAYGIRSIVSCLAIILLTLRLRLRKSRATHSSLL